MANQPIHDPLDLSTSLTKYEQTDPADSTVFNPKSEQLINNDAYLNDVKLEREIITQGDFTNLSSNAITLNTGGSHYQYEYSVYSPDESVIQGIDGTNACAYIVQTTTDDVLQLDNLTDTNTYYYIVWEVS